VKVIRHHAVGQELHARKPRDTPEEVDKPRTLLVVEKERTMGNAANQMVTPIGKVDATASHVVTLSSSSKRVTHVKLELWRGRFAALWCFL